MSCAKLSLLTVAVGYLVVVTTAQSTQDMVLEAGNVIGQAVEFFNQCGERDITYCLKERALKYLDGTSGNIELVDGVTLKETNPEKDETQNVSNPSLPDEPRARENAIDSLLMDRVTKFLSSHTLEFKLPNSAVSEMKREIDADEGRKKRRKMLLPLLILLKLKAAALLPLLLGGIALIAFKALVIGKVALVITGLIALKKLLENKETSQTYEVVAHPHHTHSHVSSFDDHHGHGHGHGHFRRALIEDPHNIPYSAYVSNQQLFGNEQK